jgi:uncharacterized membrane protein
MKAPSSVTLVEDGVSQESGGTTLRSRICLDAIPYATGAILLGFVTLIVQDFALTWQPVPAGLPGRGLLANVSGALLILGGLATTWRGAGRARLILPLCYALWVVALHIPNTVANPHLGSLLGVAEILSLAIAGCAVMQWAQQTPFRRAALILYGLCPLVFGLCHFVYVDITASMVPSWMPGKHFWAYFTGVAHMAAGVAILTGVLARLAATWLAIMAGLFALLLHFPRVVAAPTNRMEWTMLAVATSIAGGAWLIRRLILPRTEASNADAKLVLA